MKKCLLTLALVIFAMAFALAQRTVSGTVTDVDGVPLIGANVVAKGTTVGTVTDLDGRYQLNVPDGVETIIISYTGYGSQELSTTGLSVVDISLDEGRNLDEVVITATGIERNARDIVYANQTVGADELLSTPNKNALEALRGKTAGVQLTTGSGSVGASTKIVLRGQTSLTGNNNALIVVDGIPIDNSSTVAGAEVSTTGYADHGNRFNDLNPDDIESITILKGPSATSLYGSRGATGVIMVTTKKAAAGNNLKVGVNFSASQQRAYVQLQRQDQFGQGYDNSHFDSGENWSWGPAFDDKVRPWTSPVDSDGDGALEALTRPYSAVPNQLDEFFNVGQTLSTSVNISGSKNDFGYYASYSNTDQKGILENTDYKRNTVTLKANAKLSDRLNSNFKVSYANVRQNTAQEGSRAFEGNNAYAMAVQSPVNIPFGELRDYNSPFHDINGYWGSYSSVNPYYILNEYGNEAEIDNLSANMGLNYELAPGLSLIGRAGVNLVSTGVDTWVPIFQPETQLVWVDDFGLTTRDSRHSSLGSYNQISQRTINTDYTALLNYETDLTADGKWSLDLTGGLNWFQRKLESSTIETTGGLNVPGWYSVRNSVGQANSDQLFEDYRIYGLLANARLGFRNAIFLDLSARNDWSSTLPEDNNDFLYGAVGASAILTEFMDVDDNILSFLKLRGSIGTTGKDADPYLLASSFLGNPDVIDLGENTINFPLNSQPGFTTSDVIGNPNLKPELTTTFEIGADIGLFQDRANVAYTYYKSEHKDIIVQQSLPRSTGFGIVATNIGSMENRGHEVAISFKPIDNPRKNIVWNLFMTYAKNTNEVTNITDGDSDELVLGTYATPGVTIVAKEGLPYGSFKALAPQMTNDGKIIVDSVTGYPLYTDEEQYFGSYQPDFIMGFGTNLNVKGFGFDILFDWRKGGSFVSQTMFFSEFNGTSVHTTTRNREPFVLENSVKASADGGFVDNDIEVTEQDFFTDYDPAGSTYIIDASYLKLREIGLNYTLPRSVINNTPFSNVRIGLFAQNVKFWLADDNTFADPEINGPDPLGNATGIETSQVPPARSFGINLNVTF